MKTRLIDSTKASRMIATTRLNKRSREGGAQRLIAGEAPTKLSARPLTPSATKPDIVRAKSDWGDDSGKTDRRGRDAAAARAEARREAAPRQPIKPIVG
jgi:hypothetical protein